MAKLAWGPLLEAVPAPTTQGQCADAGAAASGGTEPEVPRTARLVSHGSRCRGHRAVIGANGDKPWSGGSLTIPLSPPMQSHTFRPLLSFNYWPVGGLHRLIEGNPKNKVTLLKSVFISSRWRRKRTTGWELKCQTQLRTEHKLEITSEPESNSGEIYRWQVNKTEGFSQTWL